MGYPGDQAPRQPPYQQNEPPAGHRPATPDGTFQAFRPYGAPGPSGAPPSAGPFGPPGPADPTGAPTSFAAPASYGAPRSSGPFGTPGPTGTRGPTGPFGPTGTPGPTGAPGPTGPFGPTGTPGTPGAPGPAAPAAPADRPAEHEQARQTQPSPGERPPWQTPEVVLPRPRSRRRPLLLAVGTVVVLAAAGGGLYYAAQRSGQSPVAATASPTGAPATGSSRPSGKYGYATSRATDPLPLRPTELFPKARIKNGKRTYLMTARRNDKTCKNATEGSNIHKALKAARCTQVVRASFQDSSGKIIGTVGVANLKTSAGARKVASAGAAKERKDYVKPLQGKKGATKSLGSGEALAGVWTHGHYAVLLWFQFKDGHKPTAAESKRLNLAASDITDKTVFPALDTRALTGGRG